MGIQNKNDRKSSKEKLWPQILAILAVSLGMLTSGQLFAWSSPFTLVITQDTENYNITEEEASYFATIQATGLIFGSMFFFKIAEILGRKKSILFVSGPYILCWIITIIAKTKWEFYAARFLAGIGDAAAFCSILSYVGEITTPSVRGFWGNIPLFMHYCGQFSSNVIGSYLKVDTAAYICIGIPVIFTIFVSLLPESPYQLIKDERFDDAKKSIFWFQRKPNIEEEFKKMKADVERQLSEKGKWKDLLTINSNRKALRAGIFLRCSQQLCGISVFATYNQPIFKKAGGNISPQVSSMLFSGLIWILNLICCKSPEKWGRIPTYFYSLLTCGITLVLMAVFFFIDNYQLANLENINWFPLAGMICFVLTYSFGIGVVPTLMLGELFSASIKSKGLSLLMGLWGVTVFITTNLFHVLTNNVGLYAPFLIFGVSCLLCTFLTLRWVPETKGKTLEEIQQSLKK